MCTQKDILESRKNLASHLNFWYLAPKVIRYFQSFSLFMVPISDPMVRSFQGN